MKASYLESIKLIEQLHRQFLEVIKAELDKRAVEDINAVQSLILFNIANDEVSMGELIIHGYYLGSNVSYNAKKLHQLGYIDFHRSRQDKRSIKVTLTYKGQQFKKIMDGFMDTHLKKLKHIGITSEEIMNANKGLKKLEKLWDDLLNYSQTISKCS
jgi:DNA-binding MarR family transcriptional regulator